MNLPNKVPVFPLSNFIIFPKTTVPLNIFEPRYIDMINDSMKSDRYIGIIQPKNSANFKNNMPNLYDIGCLGKIVSSFFRTLGCIIPISLLDFMLSLIISMYLGSKIFKGTLVFGKIIKLLNGKIGTVNGKSSFFI